VRINGYYSWSAIVIRQDLYGFPCLHGRVLSPPLLRSRSPVHGPQGHRFCGLGVLAPWKYVGGVRVCFEPAAKMSRSFYVTFFHSKLLLDNAASFTPSRIKDLCQKMEGKTNISRRLKQFNDLTWPTLHPYFTTVLRHWKAVWVAFDMRHSLSRWSEIRRTTVLVMRHAICRC